MTFMLMALVGVISQSFLGFLSAVPLMILSRFGIVLCASTSFNIFDDMVSKKYIYASSSLRNMFPNGYFIGSIEPITFTWYIIPTNLHQCFIGTMDLMTHTFFILAHESLLRELKIMKPLLETDIKPVVVPKNKRLELLMREGNYSCINYTPMTCECKWTAYPSQVPIIDAMHEYVIGHTSASFFVHGPPSTGKSMLALLLAHKLGPKIFIVNGFNPTDPGDSLTRLLRMVNKGFRIIVLFEEVDIMLTKIHNGQIYPHLDIPTMIKNKSDWNTFMDAFDREFYENVILFMTSNKDISYFNDMDPSYFRKGRVNQVYSIMEEPSSPKGTESHPAIAEEIHPSLELLSIKKLPGFHGE